MDNFKNHLNKISQIHTQFMYHIFISIILSNITHNLHVSPFPLRAKFDRFTCFEFLRGSSR